MNNYPYPVLTVEDSAYKDGINFELSYKKEVIDGKNMVCEIEYSLTSTYLNSLLSNGLASLYVKVLTSMYSKMIKLEGYKFKIPFEKIAEVDVIQITLYVLAEDGCEIKQCDEIKDIYGKNYYIKLRKNDILAISNTEKLDYNLNGNDFIKFKTVEGQEGNGIRISCSEENYLNILVGNSFNAAYTKVKSKVNIRDSINAHILFEAFVFTLVEIAQYQEQYENKEWYKVFVQIMASIDLDVDEFINKAIDDGKVVMEYIFEMAQKMINNEIENSIIRISKMEE